MAHRGEAGAEDEEVFGVSGEEDAAVVEQLVEDADGALPGGFVKIDEQVAAEHDVVGASLQGKAEVQHVGLGEVNRVAHRGDDLLSL